MKKTLGKRVKTIPHFFKNPMNKKKQRNGKSGLTAPIKI